ncbi:hypothetical protein [Sphingopyxis sp. PET50]|uniref:hypothetical protein n=1 Tax=Sphingopyxis sp. PET50 TaxID=2976533 RepID=UPI0021B00562|nr:hypothetical protein [Sphingopyxis sp. PET50]
MTILTVAARALICASAGVLYGCASLSPPVDPIGLAVIEWETESPPFCGRCDSLKLVVASDGRVWTEEGYWAGRYRDWRTTKRRFQVPPERVAAFRAQLQPYRPDGFFRLDQEVCKTFWTDSGGFRIKWREEGREDSLIFDRGCDPAERASQAEDIMRAPRLLGIEGLERYMR